ncbi:MAG: hypothetical protein [Wendovervirus sonii]|uniref:Glycosyltransferase n=1 Tax=phage Lak_Megaphage_Sonny TaxID=3109229 RepID=A0ABZ0Z6I3_9CAUD|nr:MAG: hypothetical protein [phage Lak_Megaphage_Sonny]
MKPYALYTTFNDNYLEQGCNMIYSFLCNNKWFEGDLIILCDHGEYAGLNEQSRQQISKLYDNVIFKDDCYDIYKDVVEHCKNLALTPNFMQCYYKLELVKKNEYERKLYLDADIIVDNKISELFFASEVRNGVVLDLGVDEASQYNLLNVISIRAKEDQEYFNAGVMIIKDEYIPDNLYDECIKFCLTCDENSYKNKFSYKGGLVDQDMFNELLPNVDLIPFMYNMVANILHAMHANFNEMHNDIFLDVINRTKIIHYCGGKFKPDKFLESSLEGYNRQLLSILDIYYRYNYLRTKNNN